MTCKEFMTIGNEFDFAESTVALRASMQKHYFECPSCRAKTNDIARAAEKDEVRDKIIDETKASDMDDPEWQEVAYGGSRRETPVRPHKRSWT